MARRFAPSIAGRWHLLESLLRTGQLVLLIWCAVLGSRLVAKGVVQAGVALVDLLR